MNLGQRDIDVHGGQGTQIGAGNVQFNLFAEAQRTGLRPGAYLEQVRRIAPPYPPGLRDRDAELAELGRFCLDAGGPCYVWWQAGPWAGKSALMSSFVLRPPLEVRERVRFVSFFITARLAAQDTREAFAQALLEELAGLTGQSLPTMLPDTTRDAYLLDLLSETATGCQRAGTRLVLVVDGLDEDRSVTTGPDAHSIAGLLPTDPPAGMRVIVAGRPNPPVPDDVPDWHPLRDPAIIRPLRQSPYARDAQRLGRQELQRLLRGSATGRDILGLLAAARGGLSGPDLAELTGTPLWEVEEILHTVAGRTFTRRAGRWPTGAVPEVYLLAHEELQAAATRYLADQFPGKRDLLHAWAGSYSGRGWPLETPEYLLGGYYQLLIDLGDLPRMIAYGLDRVRHDRMLGLTGGDAAALAEIRAALDLIGAQDAPDLASALALACRRDQLADRNTKIPVSLPAVWAALGQIARAEALANSITDPSKQARALAHITETLAPTRPLQATALAEQVMAVACSLASSFSDAKQTQADVAGILARAGCYQQAQDLARSIPDRYWEAQALTATATALAQAGHHQSARVVAYSITRPLWRTKALADVAETMARTEHPEQAAAAAGESEALAIFGRELVDVCVKFHAAPGGAPGWRNH